MDNRPYLGGAETQVLQALSVLSDSTDSPSNLRSVLRSLLHSVLPYPDPLRRRRARREARALVRCDPWPDRDANASDVAQLLLLRLLWLQRETRRALRWRLHDAAALHTRSAVEACLSGLYWLCDGTDVERLHAKNAESFRRLLSPIATGEPIPRELIDRMAGLLGSPAKLPPTLSDMADIVGKKTGLTVASDLYARLYTPLSILYAHPHGMALQRHVGPHDRIQEEPDRVWTAASMRHSVDACMAYLALAIGAKTSNKQTTLARYADAHMTRAVSPVAAMGGRAVIRGFGWSKLPQVMRLFGELRRYYDSGSAARDAYPVRKARTAIAYERMLDAIDTNPQPYRQMLLDYFADLTARSVGEEERDASTARSPVR